MQSVLNIHRRTVHEPDPQSLIQSLGGNWMDNAIPAI